MVIGVCVGTQEIGVERGVETGYSLGTGRSLQYSRGSIHYIKIGLST